MKRNGLFLTITALAVTLIWNNCGNVGFDQSSGASNLPCEAKGADLANCRNNDESIRDMSQAYAVAPAGTEEVDVLIVVDNSGSMQQEQVGIGSKIDGFLNKVKNLNWHIAVTTTDLNNMTPGPGGTARAWSDGNFRPFDSDTGSQFILRSTQVTAVNAQTLLSNAIQVGIAGSGQERAIAATSRSVSRSMTPGMQRDFFRPNAALAVIAISDEDECSTGIAGCAVGTEGLSDPQALIDLVKTQLGSQKKFSFSSIVKIPGDAGCTVAAYEGKVYKTMTDATGGVMGSVCSNDFTTPLSIIGNNVVELVKSISLHCPARDIDKDGKADVKIVAPNNKVIDRDDYTVSGTKISFKNPLAAGSYKLSYFCKI